jgi:hypothetical protein
MRSIFRKIKEPKYLVVTEVSSDGIDWVPSGNSTAFRYVPRITPDHAAEAWFVYAARLLKHHKSATAVRLAVYKKTRKGQELVHTEQVPPVGYYGGDWKDVFWPLGSHG